MMGEVDHCRRETGHRLSYAVGSLNREETSHLGNEAARGQAEGSVGGGKDRFSCDCAQSPSHSGQLRGCARGLGEMQG